MAKREFSERKAARYKREAEALSRLGLPADTDCRLPNVTISCGRYVKVEHHMGLLSLSRETVRLYTALGIVRIEGRRLIAADMDGEVMLIDGDIKLVAFEQFCRMQGKIE